MALTLIDNQVFEATMLDALNECSIASTVQTPHLYAYIKDINALVVQDVTGVNVNTIFESPTANAILTCQVATALGRRLGSWLRSFHDWSSAPKQTALRDKMAQNEPMRKLKQSVTYDSFISVLDNFPGALEGKGVQETLESVREAAARDFE